MLERMMNETNNNINELIQNKKNGIVTFEYSQYYYYHNENIARPIICECGGDIEQRNCGWNFFKFNKVTEDFDISTEKPIDPVDYLCCECKREYEIMQYIDDKWIDIWGVMELEELK